MSKNNRKCYHCGKPYYVCRACIDINSWKNICCSVDCFRKLFADENKENLNKKISENNTEIVEPIVHEEGEVVDMFVVLNKEEGQKRGKRIEIEGYDLDLGRFDCTDGKTHLQDEIDHIELTVDELKEIVKK